MTELSASDEWETPREIVAACAHRSGRSFGWDLAATTSNAVAPRHLTRAQNALRVHWHRLPSRAEDGWHGRPCGPLLWCNPPYSKPNLDLFVAKAREEATRGADLWLLVPASTSSAWFRHLWEGAACHGTETIHRGALRGQSFIFRGVGVDIELIFLGYRVSFLYQGEEISSARGPSVLAHLRGDAR